jgi:hypothetical protein
MSSALNGQLSRSVLHVGRYFCSNAWRWWARQPPIQFRQEHLLVRFGLGIAGEDQLAPVGAGVEHLDRTELVQDLSHGEARSLQPQLLLERDVYIVGDEGEEDMRLDPALQLMINRSHGEIAFEFLECGLNLSELQIELPQLRPIGRGEIGAQQTAPLAPAHCTQLGVKAV